MFKGSYHGQLISASTEGRAFHKESPDNIFTKKVATRHGPVSFLVNLIPGFPLPSAIGIHFSGKPAPAGIPPSIGSTAQPTTRFA
jgi:hypothetical protein